MKLDITGRHIDISPAIRDFTRDKLSKLDRWIDEVMEVHVILSVEKHRHIAEIVVKGRHNTFTGTDETGDMYASIGNVVDKIEKQARRQKDKIAGRRKHAVPTSLTMSGSEPPSDGDDRSSASASPRIVRVNSTPMKPMTVEDAALSLLDSDNEFLVFRDARNQRVNVLYRRRDGNLGLIEPES